MSKLVDQQESMELLSARFADLVAQEQQSRWLDQQGRIFFAAATEEQLFSSLIQSLHSKSGISRLGLLLPIGNGQFKVSQERGGLVALGTVAAIDQAFFKLLSEDSLPKPFMEPQNREFTEHLSSALQCSQLGSYYVLREGKSVMALLVIEREPLSYVLRDFATRLVERASQALILVKCRQVASLKNPDASGDTSSKIPATKDPSAASPLLNWVEDWSTITALLNERYTRLEQMVTTAVREMGADKGSLMLYEESSGELVVRAVVGVGLETSRNIRDGKQDCLRLKLGHGVAGTVAQTLRPLIVNEANTDPVFLEPSQSRVGSILCLPLHVNGLLIGVLNLTHGRNGKKFEVAQLPEALGLADLLAQTLNNSRLYHLATLEPTTEVFHRFHLYNRAEDELTRARRYQRQLSLVAVQFQSWDSLRPQLGHYLCNQLEIGLARILRATTRECDSVGRLTDGGFGVLLPETDSLGAFFMAERIHQMLEADSLMKSHSVTVCLGVATYPDRADSVPTLFMRAEAALRSALSDTTENPVCLVPSSLEHSNRFLRVASL
jgi:diguanylate cyclase (GGDEF)-like protein